MVAMQIAATGIQITAQPTSAGASDTACRAAFQVSSSPHHANRMVSDQATQAKNAARERARRFGIIITSTHCMMATPAVVIDTELRPLSAKATVAEICPAMEAASPS